MDELYVTFFCIMILAIGLKLLEEKRN